MAVRFNNYQPGAQLAAALDQADRQYQDKLALGWVPSERDPDQGFIGSFWDSFTSSAESTLGGALTAAGVVADSPWLAGVGGDLTRQAARYSDWANDYDNNPDKSRWSLGYLIDPHGLSSDAGVMLGSSAPGMLAGAALASGGGMVLPALGILGSAGLEVGANFGQNYMDAKRDNIESQIETGQRPTGTVYDGTIDQSAWDSFTGDPYKNAELIGSSFMDTAIDVATGATGGLFSLAGKGLAKAGLADALASNGGKVAGAVLGDAARADTMLGRAAYGLSTASKPIDFVGNRIANAFGEGFQEAWQQRVQDAMANKFDDDRADAGSFFRDIVNGSWDNFTDAEANSFNSAFLPTLVSGVGVAGVRGAGRYLYNNIDSLGPTVEAKRDYNDLMQTTGIANALADSTDLSDYIGHEVPIEQPLMPNVVADNAMSITGDTVIPQQNNVVPVMPDVAAQEAPVLPNAITTPVEEEPQPIERNDAMSKFVDATREKMADLPDILTRAYNNADIDAINQNIPEENTKLSPELLNKAVNGDTGAAYYILSNLDRKNVVNAVRERNNEKKAQAKQAKQELSAIKNDIKNIIKGVGKKDADTEAIQKAQDIIHALAPSGKAEELADKTKSRFLKVNQPLLDRANNGDTNAIRDVLRAIDPNAYMEAKNRQERAQAQQPVEDVTDVPTDVPTDASTDVREEKPVSNETQNNVQKPQKQAEQTKQKATVENKPVATEQETVPQNKIVSPLIGLAKPQVAQTEQDTQNVHEQPVQNVQNGEKQRYLTEKKEGQTEVGKTTQPVKDAVNNDRNSRANVIANIDKPDGLDRARNIIHKLNGRSNIHIPERALAVLKTANKDIAKQAAVTILKSIPDDVYNNVIKADEKGSTNDVTSKNDSDVTVTPQKQENVADNTQQSAQPSHPNSKANVIANASTTKGLNRARNILDKFIKGKHVKVDKDTAAKIANKNEYVSKQVITKLLQDIDDDTYNRVMNIPTGGKNEDIKSSESTESSTNSKTEARTEIGRDTHQQRRLDNDGTSSEAEGSETSTEQTDKEEVTHKLNEKDIQLFQDDGGPVENANDTSEENNENKTDVVNDNVTDDYINDELNKLSATVDSITNTLASREHEEESPIVKDLPSLNFVKTGVVQDSADVKANKQYNKYRDGKLYNELKDVVGRYYGTINRMSFANLVTILPEAKQYISFLGGAHKFKSKEEEFHAKMQYIAAFGSLASYGINMLRDRMTVDNGADRNGNVNYDGSNSFEDAYADLLDILPGAIHTAIVTYDGARVMMEKAEAAQIAAESGNKDVEKPKGVASLNTWFFYVLNSKYQQYIVDRGGDSLILAKISPNQLYSVTGDFFIGADEDKGTALQFVQRMSSYNMPKELHAYGIKKFGDAVPWLLSQYINPEQGVKSTGRKEIIAAVNNVMVRGEYAEELRKLLNKFKKTKKKEDFDAYTRKFIYAFSHAFLSVMNTDEGKDAWNAYRIMQILGNVNGNIVESLSKVSKDVEQRANEYGKTFIIQLAYDLRKKDNGEKESQADLDLKAYIKRLHDAFINDIAGNKSLTREGRAVAISKANIIAEALALAESAKDKYKQTDNEELRKEEAGKDRQYKKQDKNSSGQDGEGDENNIGDKRKDKTGGGVENKVNVVKAIKNEFRDQKNVTSERALDYMVAARAARYLAITSFEIQLCNELDTGLYKKMLKQKNQDGAFLSSTEKANLMIAFIVRTVRDNFGDLGESEFAQHKGNSDADDVREYAINLITKIKSIFPTAETKGRGRDYWHVSMRDFEQGLEQICKDIKEDPRGKKLFGLTYSHNIISKMRVDGKEVNKLVSRRTTKFPWLNTKTTKMMLPANEFEESKFVGKFIADNKFNIDDIDVSDMSPIITEDGKRRHVSVEKYKQIMKVLGYDEDTINELNKFNDEWIENLWEKCYRKKVNSEDDYNKTKDEFINRWQNAINKAKRGVLSIGMMGAGHFYPTDSSVALKLGFAVKHGITKLDAVLLSKALESKIEYLAEKMEREHKVDTKNADPDHRVVELNKRVYNFAYGMDTGKYAAELKDKRVVTYEGLKYLLTDRQYKEYVRAKKDEDKLAKLKEFCQAENRVVTSVREERGANAAAGKEVSEPNLINGTTMEFFAKKKDSKPNDTNYVTKEGILQSSGTVVGAIATLLHDYFDIDESDIPNNVMTKAVLVVNSTIPKDVLINNGLNGYIENVAKGKDKAVVRKRIMDQIKKDVNKFVSLEQMEIAGKVREDSLTKLTGSANNPQNDSKFTEGPDAFRDNVNIISLKAIQVGKKIVIEENFPKFNYSKQEIEEKEYINSLTYTKLREAILGALNIMDYEGRFYKVKKLDITDNSPIKSIKGNINIHDTDSTKWKAKEKLDLYENPIASILQYMGSVDKLDLKEEYGKDIPYTIENLMASPEYNYLMMAHNDSMMGSDGLITSLHTFSYELAQKDKLSYTDIANLCSLFTIASKRLKGLDNTNKFADTFNEALGKVTTNPKLFDSNQSYDVENVDLPEGMKFVYGRQLHKLQPFVSAIEDLSSEREDTELEDITRMSKENVAFLGNNFKGQLDEDVNIQFAHTLFLNRASETLGVAPYIHSMVENGGKYKESAGRLESEDKRSTVYHELMHAFTDEAVTIDLKKGKYRLARPSDKDWKDEKFGGVVVNRDAKDLPDNQDIRDEAEDVIREALKKELKKSLEILNSSDSLLAGQLLAITRLIDVNKLVDDTAGLWTIGNLVGYDSTKTGKDRFVSKVGATTLNVFYDNVDPSNYETLVMSMILPSIIFGAKTVNKEIPLFYSTKKLITETYSHLDTTPPDNTEDDEGKNIAGSDSSEFMASWLYESAVLLRKLDLQDPDHKIRNEDKKRMREQLKNAATSVSELTNFGTLKFETQKNQHATIKKDKKKKKTSVGTSKGAITNARDVSHDAGSPRGWFMQLLYAIANKRNKTFSQTSTSKLNHAKDIKLALIPGMRWLEELVSKKDADRLFDESQRSIAYQQELNARSDAYVKQLQQLLTIDGNKLQTKALRQYFNTEINVNSDRGRDIVELFDLPYEAGQDERCKNRSSSGKNAMLKVYDDDVFFVLHNQPDKATAMAKMNDKIDKMKAYYKKKNKTFYKNQAFWYREDTGTLVFYACKDERMKDGKFKNLFIAYPSNEDGTGVEGQARMRARLQKQVLRECEQFRRKLMQQRGYAKPVIDGFIASQALYRALLMNAYQREQKRAMQNDDIINRMKTGFLHAYAPRYYARYILQKEVWNEITEEQANKNEKSKDEGFIIQRGDKYYHVITYSIGSFESKRDRSKYRNEHPIGKNERYVEKTRDEWLQEQGGGRTDIVGNVDTSIGTLTNNDVSRGKKEAELDISGKLATFISRKFNDNEEWQGDDSIERVVNALRNMDGEDEEEFGKYKPRLIHTAKMIRVSKDKAKTFKQVSGALKANGAQYLAANYARERTSNSGLYSHDVIGSLKHYLHTVNSVEALTPFYRDMTQTIYKYTNRNYDRTKRDSYYSEYNIMCELVDNMNGRDKPVDAFMRRLSVMVVDAIYAVPGMRSILNACGVYLPDMWLPALLHNSIAVNVYLKLGMFNVSTALAQYAQLANVYAFGGGEAFAYAMKKMPGILAKAHKPSDILKNDFDVSAYGKEIQQVMADLYLTKSGKSLIEQEGEKAFDEALKRGDKTAIELQVFNEVFGTLTGKDDGLAMNDMAAQLGNAGSAYEGESVIDKMPKTGKKILDLGMGGFRGADLACRLFAGLVAQHLLDTSPKYKAFRESKSELGEERYNAERMAMIRDFIYRTNFNFNRATDPLLLAKGGQLAKCVFQFASYGFQTFDLMYWMLKNKKSTELKRFLGTMMLFSGVISGIPMMTMISGMCQAITGTNPEDWIKAFILKAAGRNNSQFSRAIGEALCYGIAAPVFGVDISKKVGLADIMKDPTDLRNLGGPSLGTAIDFSSAVGASFDAILYDKYTTDQLMFAWFKAVPAASRWLQAARGQYYSYSKLMPKTEYQSMSGVDRVKNAMGFNPIENKLNTDLNRFVTDINQDYSNSAKDVMIAYVNNPTDANLKKLQAYGKTPEQAHKAVDKYIKPKVTAEQAEKMVTKSSNEEADIVRSNVRALGNLLS